VSQCDGKVGGAGGCWVQIERPDEMRPDDGRSVAERTYAAVGRVGWQSKTRSGQPRGLRGTRSGGGYACSDNLGALREIPKKKTMSSLQAEKSKSHGEKPVPTGLVPELRICVGSVLVADRAERCDGWDVVENTDQSDLLTLGASLGWR